MTSDPRPVRPRVRPEGDELLFLVLLGLLATVLGYRFGFGNQLEQLPLVLRAMDPALFEADFYVRSAEGFGPRFYYVKLLAALGSVFPLPSVVFGLAWLVNTAIAAITHFASRDLLGGDRLVGFLTAMLAVAVGGFPLGLVTDIRFHDFQPGSLAIPACLAALWAGLRGRPLLAAALAGAGSLPHPLYGIETGGLALGTAAGVRWLRAEPSERLRALLPVLGGGALLGAVAVVFWGLPWLGANPERLPDAEFISVLTFRSPHHYLPSLFPVGHYLLLATFLLAAGLAGWRWRAAGGDPVVAVAFLLAPAAVLALCVGGYLLVEVWPSRTWVTAQPFRLLYLVKWQGYLLLGWLFTTWIHEVRLPRSGLGWIGLFGTGAAQPLVALGVQIAEGLDRWGRRRISDLPTWLVPSVALLVSTVLVLQIGKSRESVALWVASFAALALRPPGRALYRAFACVLVVAIAAFAFANRSAGWTDWKVLRPVWSFEDQHGPDAEVARWAGEQLPEAALFLVPPGMGLFRLIAERSVVVDFKALPFPELALREWKERMQTCYGPVPGAGFAALSRMDAQHRAGDDARLARVAERYGAAYAVLYLETETTRPVVYANDAYKIVEL